MKVLDLRDKRYWTLMLNIGLPIAVQNLIFNSFTLVDNILVGGLGDTNIAAVGIANKLTFIYMLFLFGINSGANIFSAQFWGKKDINGVRKVLGLSLILGLSVSAPFTAVGIFAPHHIIDIFSDDPAVIRQGADYLRIIALTFPISAVASSYGMQSRGVGRAKVPLIASAFAFTVNAVLDYVLIYGKLGMPAMGITGAALATLIAKIMECVIMLGIIYWNNYELAARLREFKGYTREFMIRLVKPISPVIINEVFWALGVTGYTYFYGILGTEAVATVQILDVVNGIFMSLFLGLGNACGAITGNLIGAGEEETAKTYAKRSIIAGVGMAMIMSVIVLLTAPLFLGLFNISAATLEISKKTIIVYTAFMIPKIVNMIMIVGVCRGGGDTVFAALVDVGAPWLIGMPMAFLGVRVFELPLYFVIAMINIEEIAKCILGIQRLISNKWLHNLVKDIKNEEDQLITEAAS